MSNLTEDQCDFHKKHPHYYFQMVRCPKKSVIYEKQTILGPEFNQPKVVGRDRLYYVSFKAHACEEHSIYLEGSPFNIGFQIHPDIQRGYGSEFDKQYTEGAESGDLFSNEYCKKNVFLVAEI